MLVDRVNLDSNVYEMLVNHALSNEREEIMGLLIGNIEPNLNDSIKCASNIHMSIVFERLDKRADRVEISPEQLSLAAEFAEKLSNDLNKNYFIIGWYHSHPRITVLPSLVDIKTQNMYEMMDKNFIGIIVSVYNQTKANCLDNVEIICFQSENNALTQDSFRTIPLEIRVNDGQLIKNNLQTLYKIPQLLMQEENNSFKKNINNNENFVCSMSNIGIYLHSTSHIIDISYLEMLNSLKCRREINHMLIKNAKMFLEASEEEIAVRDENK